MRVSRREQQSERLRTLPLQHRYLCLGHAQCQGGKLLRFSLTPETEFHGVIRTDVPGIHVQQLQARLICRRRILRWQDG